jgi:cytochrome c-type biogenesis protein CcmF
MTTLGQVFLLTSLICAGYSAFVCLAYQERRHPLLHRIAAICGMASWLALTGVMVILVWALLERDFHFDYVARYSSRLLSWKYSVSALWVGQAGSLLLWAWMLASMAIFFRFLPTTDAILRDSAFGMLMMYLSYLTGLMIFAADPCQANLVVRREGLGLSPILQHPSMLLHPPVVFLAYATWTIPFALATAALLHKRLDGTWTQMARPWALFAWAILGIGLLLGAHWAYQELGWGGYWGWDPVENGSLLPWLTGAAFIHTLMAWRYRQCHKKMAVSLAILTFGLCNFATFLTRSGIFSSVHAFSESPIGWFFLAIMAALLFGGVTLVYLRRHSLVPERIARSLLARETLIAVSTLLLMVMTLVVMTSTLVGPLSAVFYTHTIVVEPAFYNYALVPVGLILIALAAVVPLLRWGEGPGPLQRRVLHLCLAGAAVVVAVSYCLGVQHPISLSVAGLAAMAGAAILGAIFLHVRQRSPHGFWHGLLPTLGKGRRQFAGYVAHIGFIVLAVGITGSSLGNRRHEADMDQGEVLRWADREIRYVKLAQQTLPDKLIAEAVLEITRDGHAPVTLRPARHFHLLQNEWTTEVAIHSSWGGDFYTILEAGLGDGKVALTFVDNPMICWIWLGGLIVSLSTLTAAWPDRRHLRSNTLETESRWPAHKVAADDRPLRRAA